MHSARSRTPRAICGATPGVPLQIVTYVTTLRLLEPSASVALVKQCLRDVYATPNIARGHFRMISESC